MDLNKKMMGLLPLYLEHDLSICRQSTSLILTVGKKGGPQLTSTTPPFS